jgi:uncharacterized protein YbjQ (UPF0145 family)
MNGGRRQTPLGMVISYIITAIVLIIIFLWFFPICSIIILVVAIILPILVIWNDSKGPYGDEIMTDPLFTSTKEGIPGTKSYEIVGIVFGSCVKTRNIFSQARAELRSLVGGEAKQFTSLMDQSKHIALNRLYRHANSLGAKGIVGLRFITAQTMLGASEIIAYGTAVKF